MQKNECKHEYESDDEQEGGIDYESDCDEEDESIWDVKVRELFALPDSISDKRMSVEEWYQRMRLKCMIDGRWKQIFGVGMLALPLSWSGLLSSVYQTREGSVIIDSNANSLGKNIFNRYITGYMYPFVASLAVEDLIPAHLLDDFGLWIHLHFGRYPHCYPNRSLLILPACQRGLIVWNATKSYKEFAMTTVGAWVGCMNAISSREGASPRPTMTAPVDQWGSKGWYRKCILALSEVHMYR